MMSTTASRRHRRSLCRWTTASPLSLELMQQHAQQDTTNDDAAAAAFDDVGLSLASCRSVQELEDCLEDFLGDDDCYTDSYHQLDQVNDNGNHRPVSKKGEAQQQQQQQQQQPSVYYPPRYDFAWLTCRKPSLPRPKSPKSQSDDDASGRAMPLAPSIVGLKEELLFESEEEDGSDEEVLEEDDYNDDNNSDARLDMQYWKNVVVVDVPAAGSTERNSTLSGSCTCPARPRVDWTRCQPQTNKKTNNKKRTCWSVDLVDLREAPPSMIRDELAHSPAHVYHFLRSLLSPQNDHSPWMSSFGRGTASSATTTGTACRTTATDDDDEEDARSDVVLLLLPVTCSSSSSSSCCAALQDFRIADACPAWYLHSVATLQTAKTTMPTKTAFLQCFVYRRLPPRVALSSVHWETLQPVPMRGCLWERYTIPKKKQPEPPPTTTNTTTTTATQQQPQQQQQTQGEEEEPPQQAIRCVGPPFLNALAEFPELQGVLDHLKEIQEEARSIAHWTAWPEEQHYSSSAGTSSSSRTDQDSNIDSDNNNNNNNNNNDNPAWTVFPLCYCFPANDVSARKWVPITTSLVPRTTQILQALLCHQDHDAGNSTNGNANKNDMKRTNRLRTALFSRLAPGARLFAHTGWDDLANHVLRVHVPVTLPPSATTSSSSATTTTALAADSSGCFSSNSSMTGLWVDGCVTTFDDYQTLVCFDDSKMHWAYNYHKHERIVLILDMERPKDLPPGTATGGHTDELDKFIQQVGAAPTGGGGG